MWKEHTPYPWNQMPDTYSFLVRHGMLWRIAYTTIQPRAIHIPYLSAMYTFMGKHLHEAFDQYDPDLVVSVHPLMQHINTRVLAARAKRLGRARATPFATVVTDFTTCHNTWFCRSEGGMGSHHRQQMIEPYVSVLCHMQSGCSSRNITQSHCSINDSVLQHGLQVDSQVALCPLVLFYRDVDRCFVPTEFCKQLGKRMGLSDAQLVLYGLPIRPVFDKKLPPKRMLRKKLVS